MKQFAKVVGGALVLFIALAMLQEHDTFSTNWFKPAEGFQAPATERRAAAEAVHAFRMMSAHWYGSGGDRRFEERLPASQPLIEELRSDIRYLEQNGRIETPRLMRIEFLSSDVTSENSAEVKTREFWVTEFHWRAGGVSDESRSDVLFARYRLQKDGSRWLVAAWDPQSPPEQEAR